MVVIIRLDSDMQRTLLVNYMANKVTLQEVTRRIAYSFDSGNIRLLSATNFLIN
jgi:hypothetical protein